MGWFQSCGQAVATQGGDTRAQLAGAAQPADSGYPPLPVKGCRVGSPRPPPPLSPFQL